MSDVFGALEGLSSGGDLLAGATRAGVAYVIWGFLQDDELDSARAAMASLAEDETLRNEAAMRRSEKLRAIGSEATFFSGLARVDGEFRSIRVAVTPQDFVLLDGGACVELDAGEHRGSVVHGDHGSTAAAGRDRSSAGEDDDMRHGGGLLRLRRMVELPQ